MNISTSFFNIPGAYPPPPSPYHLVIFSFISLLSLCQAARVFACVRPFTPALKPDSSNLSYLFHLRPHPTHNTRLISNWVYNLYPWWIFWKVTESMMDPQSPLSMEHAWEATTTHYYLVFIHECLWLYKMCLEKSSLHFLNFFVMLSIKVSVVVECG
jgi:hypothetical protein